MLTLLVLRVSLSGLLRAGPARLATMQCGCSPTNIDWLAAGERVGIADVFTSCLHLGCEPTELTCAPVADDPFIYAIHFARLCLVDVACATGPRRKAFICVCAVRCGTCYTPLPVLGIGTGRPRPYLDSGFCHSFHGARYLDTLVPMMIDSE